MVDQVGANNNNPIQNGSLLNSQTQTVKDVNQQAAANSSAVSSLKQLDIQDGVQISMEARNRLESEKDVLRFSRLAQRVQEDFDHEKVNRIKNLLNSGRINEYLRGINTEEMADKILDSPFGNYLR
jgi:predicted lipid-binding transport protein (Tim44 family)